MQGSSQSLFEICVSSSVLCLWSGISNSPINGAQAGYGVGALIAVFISKPFVKFNPVLKNEEEINRLKNEIDSVIGNKIEILYDETT